MSWRKSLLGRLADAVHTAVETHRQILLYAVEDSCSTRSQERLRGWDAAGAQDTVAEGSRACLRDAGPDDGAGARDGAVGDQDLAAAGGVDEHAERAAV